MRKTKDVSDEDEYSADDPDEVEGGSEEEWTPDNGAEVSPRHTLRFYARVLVAVVPFLRDLNDDRVARLADHHRRSSTIAIVTFRRRPRDNTLLRGVHSRSYRSHTRRASVGGLEPLPRRHRRDRCRRRSPSIKNMLGSYITPSKHTRQRPASRELHRAKRRRHQRLPSCRCHSYREARARDRFSSAMPSPSLALLRAYLELAIGGSLRDRRVALLERTFRGKIVHVLPACSLPHRGHRCRPVARPPGGADCRIFQIAGAKRTARVMSRLPALFVPSQRLSVGSTICQGFFDANVL